MSRPVLLAIFALSLAVSLWFNFAFLPESNAAVADGAEYMRVAKTLGHALNHDPSFYFKPSPEREAELTALKVFKQSGLVFPGYILLCWLVTGSAHAVTSWQAPVFGQCLLAAAASIFLAWTGNLLWGPRAGIACGVMAAIYPAFIVNSGRLYSESFAASFSSIILFTICRGYSGIKRGRLEIFFLGLNLAMLHLTRSLLVILTVLSYPITYWQDRKNNPRKQLLMLFLGMAVILAPWLFLQKAVFNKMSVIVDRIGNYNLFIGTNTNIDGWLSYPYPDCTNLETRSAASILIDNVRQGPRRFAFLLLEKPYRLFKFPWNDFRTAIGPCTFFLQVIFHQLMLLLCAVGIGCALFGQGHDKQVLKARCFVLAYGILHCLYFGFITVPRYGLTAVPAIILFAGAGLTALLSLLERERRQFALLAITSVLMFLTVRLNEIGVFMQLFGNQALSVAAFCLLKLGAAACFFVVLAKSFPGSQSEARFARPAFWAVALSTIFLVVFPSRANGRIYEWQCLLSKAGDSAIQEIKLKDEQLRDLSGKQIFLLVDADGSGALMRNGRIKVNGITLGGPLIPGIALTEDFSAVKTQNEEKLYLECEWIYDCMSKPAGMSAADVRQWFWVALPAQAAASVLATGKASVEIENVHAQEPIKLFGYYLSRKQTAIAPSIDSSSWEKAFYAVESDRGLTDSRYDAKTVFRGREEGVFRSQGRVDSRDLSPALGLQNGCFSLLLAAARDKAPGQPPTLRQLPPRALHLQAPVKEEYSVLVTEPAQSLPAQLWLVRLKGRSCSKDGPLAVRPELKLLIDSKGGRKFVYPCRWMPHNLPNGPRSLPFDYCFPLMPSALPGQITALDISFKGAGDGSLEIEDLALEILPLPSNPLTGRQGIY